MTIDTTTTNPSTEQKPGSVFSKTFPNWVMAVVGMRVDYGRFGVLQDIEGWINWMLSGGEKRPRLNKRSTDGTIMLRNYICAALDAALEGNQLNFHDTSHWDLVERATRPLPGNVPLVDLRKAQSRAAS